MVGNVGVQQSCCDVLELLQGSCLLPYGQPFPPKLDHADPVWGEMTGHWWINDAPVFHVSTAEYTRDMKSSPQSGSCEGISRLHVTHTVDTGRVAASPQTGSCRPVWGETADHCRIDDARCL